MCLGSKLLPDYFLDEAEDFQDQWLESKASQGSSGPEGSKDSPEGVFKVAESLITPEIAKQVNATFLFVVDGKYPGVCIECSECCQCV